ncbi:DUF7010 family protein [Clostridium cellulovorans]|uniref:DUF7010 family protein n=1 Tax=Clostridium cellulovorans TaxID=1493 RepID=UPI003BF7B7CB
MHIIITSVFIWCLVLLVWLLPIKNIESKNMLTFFVLTPLLPFSYVVSKIVKSEFSSKDNPLNKLGLLFSMNQMLYILIHMWVYPTVPDKMLMVMAIIFGAHLMPFGWLYKSRAYSIMSVVSITALIIVVKFNSIVLSIVMIVFEIVFSIWLMFENSTSNSLKS